MADPGRPFPRGSATLGDVLWRHPDFRRLWVGDTVSQFGTRVSVLAMPLIAVDVLAASTFEVGLLTTFETLAFLVIGLPAGAWVDRLSLRRVLITNDLLRAVVLLSIPLTWSFGGLRLPQLYLVAVVFGVCTVFFDVAYQSYLPVLVDRAQLIEGNAKLEGSRAVAEVAGPGLGGQLIGWLRPVGALWVDAVSFVWSAFWLSRIRTRQGPPPVTVERQLGAEIKEGLAFVAGHPLLRPIAATTGTSNLFSAAAGSILLVLLARELDLSPAVIGAVFSIASVGGVIGVLVTGPVTRRLGQGPTIWLSALVIALPSFAAPFVQRGWSLWAYAAATAVTGLGVVVYNITQVSFRQGVCPQRLLGRMNATMRFLVWGTMPLGGLLGATLGSVIGVRSALLVAAVGKLLAVLPAYASPLRRLRELPDGASDDL